MRERRRSDMRHYKKKNLHSWKSETETVDEFERHIKQEKIIYKNIKSHYDIFGNKKKIYISMLPRIIWFYVSLAIVQINRKKNEKRINKKYNENNGRI